MEADELPEFPGGTVSLLEYLRKNIKYPAVCRENNVQGRVVVSFIIDIDGSITDAEVVRSVDPLLDAEALRTISQMPAWKPGKKDGNIVKVKYSVPINFRLDSSTARSATPQWIYLYDATLGKESYDNVFSALLSSSDNDVQGTGIVEMPEVKALRDAFKSAQIEAEAMQRSFTDEMSSIHFKIQNYERQRETSLSESQRTSLEQEIAEAEVMLRQKHQELNNKLKEWSDEMEKSLEPQMETVWQLISKNGAYVCIDHFEVNPPNDAVVAPDNLASALNDLFEGRRYSVFLPFSDDNYQQVKTLLSEKYSNETVFFRHR